MKQQFDNIFQWFNSLSMVIKVFGSVIIIGGTILNGIGIYNNFIVKKYESKVSIDLKQVKDTLTGHSIQNKAILVWMKGIDSKIEGVTNENVQTKSTVTTLQGAYFVLDRSYVRTLEKTLKANEELSKYKDEKIVALQEALQKKN